VKPTDPSEPAELADYFWRSLLHDVPRVRAELRKLVPCLGEAVTERDQESAEEKGRVLDDKISGFLQTFWLPEPYRVFAMWELHAGVPETRPRPKPPASWSSPIGADDDPHRKAEKRARKRVRDAVKQNIQPALRKRLHVVLRELDGVALHARYLESRANFHAALRDLRALNAASPPPDPGAGDGLAGLRQFPSPAIAASSSHNELLRVP
jgi:hypothetical protein